MITDDNLLKSYLNILTTWTVVQDHLNPISLDIENIKSSPRITSYNVCYTKLLRDSSRPAVSVTAHGPKLPSSIFLVTGSVVVPGTSEIIDTFFSNRLFIIELLPAFLKPVITTLTDSANGVSYNFV